MKNKKFSIQESIIFGWETTKKNLVFFGTLFIMFFLMVFAYSFLEEILDKKSFFYWFFYSIVFVVSSLVSLGLVKISLNFIDGLKSEIKDVFSQSHLIFDYLVGYLIYLSIIFIGFIFLIIPGFYFMVRLSFFDYLIVDKKMKPVESLKTSWAITNGSFLNLVLFGSVIFLINVIGAMLLFVGLFISVPIAMIASAFVYRKLLNQISIIPTQELDNVIKE